MSDRNLIINWLFSRKKESNKKNIIDKISFFLENKFEFKNGFDLKKLPEYKSPSPRNTLHRTSEHNINLISNFLKFFILIIDQIRDQIQ